MKIRSTFHLLALLMAVLTFGIPFITPRAAQTEPSAQHTQGASCLMPGISTAPTSSVQHILYAQQLLGKSPEYVANYAQNPQTATKKVSAQTAIQGCLIIGAVVGVVYIIWMNTLLGFE